MRKFVSAVSFAFVASSVAISLAAPTSALAQRVSAVVLDNYATQPAINDRGEIVYLRTSAELVSTWRGLLATGVDASNVGISNSGEVVYANGAEDSRVTSTVRGVLTSYRSYAPSISASTGEVGYLGNRTSSGPSHFFTTLRGQVESLDQSVYYSPGVGDVNDLGEVVFEVRRLDETVTRIFSTTRGFLTPAGFNAIQPALNNYGEVIYSGNDSFGRQQIFSTDRGQLTFFGGKDCFATADLPDINNEGEVVFRAVLCSGDQSAGLYKMSLKPKGPKR